MISLQPSSSQTSSLNLLAILLSNLLFFLSRTERIETVTRTVESTSVSHQEFVPPAIPAAVSSVPSHTVTTSNVSGQVHNHSEAMMSSSCNTFLEGSGAVEVEEVAAFDSGGADK